MKTKSLVYLISLTCFAAAIFASCSKEEAKPAGLNSTTIQGSWLIVTGSEAAEWQKDVGIITPRAAFTELNGYKLSFSGNMMSVLDPPGNVVFGPSTWNLNDATGFIEIGTDAANGLGGFTIKNFVAGISMEWDQRDPVEADYEYKLDCDCFLYYQKFLKLTKAP